MKKYSSVGGQKSTNFLICPWFQSINHSSIYNLVNCFIKSKGKHYYSEIRSGTTGRKRGTKQVPEARENTILGMYAVGIKQVDIVRHYELSKSTVSSIIKRGRSSSEGGNEENRGRKPKISERLICSLLSYAENNRFKLSCNHCRI